MVNEREAWIEQQVDILGVYKSSIRQLLRDAMAFADAHRESTPCAQCGDAPGHKEGCNAFSKEQTMHKTRKQFAKSPAPDRNRHIELPVVERQPNTPDVRLRRRKDDDKNL